jgi:hypothetical protein
MRETATWAHLGCVLFLFLAHRLLYRYKRCDSIHVFAFSLGQIWPCPDAEGARVLPFDYPCIPDLE